MGKLDAFNLFDPSWKDLEYDIWYHLLNCGIPLPASTGTDWFISSNNRVYVQTDGAFTYESWLKGLQAGRTFITNGPALFLNLDGQPPGGAIESPNGSPRTASGRITWQSHYPLSLVELVYNGVVTQTVPLDGMRRGGEWAFDLRIESDGWVAARAFGEARDSFGQPIYAHTSPIYIGSGLPVDVAQGSAAFFVRSIDSATEIVNRDWRFATNTQREEVLHLFNEGRKVYQNLAEGG